MKINFFCAKKKISNQKFSLSHILSLCVENNHFFCMKINFKEKLSNCTFLLRDIFNKTQPRTKSQTKKKENAKFQQMMLNFLRNLIFKNSLPAYNIKHTLFRRQTLLKKYLCHLGQGYFLMHNSTLLSYYLQRVS